jgi:hypothetical protein
MILLFIHSVNQATRQEKASDLQPFHSQYALYQYLCSLSYPISSIDQISFHPYRYDFEPDQPIHPRCYNKDKTFTCDVYLRDKPLRGGQSPATEGGAMILNFDFASLTRLRNQILLGLLTFGFIFPIAWTLCSFMVSYRLGGEQVSPDIARNPLLQGMMNNVSIPTITPDSTNLFRLSPFVGLVPLHTDSLLWWIGVFSLVFFIFYFWTSSNFHYQSADTCGVPSKIDAGKQFIYLLIPPLFPGLSFVANYFTEMTNMTNFNPRRGNLATTWGQKSILWMSIALVLIVFINFISLWGTCATSFYTIGFALFFTVLLGATLYFTGDVSTWILRKIAYLFGIHMKEGEEDRSFFMRISWILFAGIPAYIIASSTQPVFVIQHIAKMCGV